MRTASGSYTVVAVNATTSCTAKNMTGTATISINPLPNLYTMNAGGSYCASGTGVDVSLSGSDAGISYQLYNGIATVGVPVIGVGGVL